MEKKKVKLFSAIALVALALLVVGVTYAYFQNQYGSASNADVNVTTYTTDVLTFATGDDINLEADQTTFGKDKGSVSGATYASALLTANNKTNKAVEHYYLYLNIENNTFTYSVQDNKPELIMTITDKDGNEVKNIEGLTYTEVTDRTNKKISGYDITTKSGLVTIFNNREIIAAPKAEDKWNITITFVNYEADQNANTGKALSAKLMIQKESLSVANICKNGQSLSSCIVAMNGVDDNLYHHDGTLENGINDGSYRYAGGRDSCKYNGTDVSNVDGKFGRSLKGDCDSVSMVYSEEVLYIDKSINKIFTDKTTIKWDNANNKCVTTNGEEVQLNADEEYYQSLCNGYAYKMDIGDGEPQWVGGVKIEELGPGEETLFTPEGKENQKPALYSCKYNGIDVLNGEGEINSSLKGDCSSVFKYSAMVDEMYIDKSLDKAIANKQAVKWDSANNKCVTSTGADVSIEFEEDCTGDAYFIGGKWLGNVVIENMGVGVKTEGVKNYVCFGSNESPCPTDNLYRIIGVFGGQVKLIKYDYANSNLLGKDGDYSTDTFSKSGYSTYKGELTTINTYYWNYKNDTSINNGHGSNEWSTSLLNKINLNTNYLNNIGSTWSNLIEDTTWKVSGKASKNTTDSVIPKAMYTAEITNATKTYGPENGTSKIGLMYASDYGFAADPSAWTTTLGQYQSEREKNWMYMGLVEWTIAPSLLPSYISDYSSIVFSIVFGRLESGSFASGDVGVRPVLYLKASVAYAGGSGTIDSPITLAD